MIITILIEPIKTVGYLEEMRLIKMKSYNGFTPEQRMEGDRIIKQAIAEGKLEPAKECRVCGQRDGILHIHAEDYRPDKILKNCRCLCWRCHMILHSRYRNRDAFLTYFREVREGKKFLAVYKNDFSILRKEHGIN